MVSFWKSFAFAAGLASQQALAQQYAGDVIPNSLPSVPGSEIVYFKIKDPAGVATNLTLTNYYSLQQNGNRLVGSQIKRAVIIIHGQDRDPNTYMSNMLSALSQSTDSNVNFGSVAIMAPYFPNGDDKNYGYPYNTTSPTTGKKLSGGKQSYTNALVWQGAGWSGGGTNQYPVGYSTVSTFHVLDQLVQYFDNKTLFPNLNQIVVAGHSLGGQTVQRYVVLGVPTSSLSVTTPVTYWIANPNAYAWLNSSRPDAIGTCTTYDNWRYGLQNYTGAGMIYNTALFQAGSTAAIPNYEGKSKAYARGTQDLGDDSSTCEPYSTGANRNERFFNFINYFPATCASPNMTSGGQCDTVDLINAGHDGGAMMASSAGQARLFYDNFYGDGSRSYDFGYPREASFDDPYPNPGLVSNGTANSTYYAGNMTLQGCYTDSGSRTLTTLAYDNSSNTIEMCTSSCNGLGYSVAGVEYGTQCWCGNNLGSATSEVIANGCAQACAGNSSEICGGANRLSIYSNGQPTQAGIPGNPETADNGNYYYVDCYTEATSGRALSAGGYTDTQNMTIDSCASYCAGYKYFGIEYAQECYCGSSLASGSAATSGSTCSMVCTGNSLEVCGGPGALSLYQLSSGSSLSVISQGATSTTTQAVTSTGTTTGTTTATTSGIPSASLCPSAGGQQITDANNNTYTVTCSSDSTQGSFTSSSATNSYLDCMVACDGTATCTAFTYVGGSYGTGSGTCWLKTAFGSASASGNNYISAVLVSNSKGSSSSGTTTSSAATSTTSTAVASGSLCPSAGGQQITDSNGSVYAVTCSSDSTQGSYTNGQATKSYLDCMTLCDAASSTGCTAFTYVGGSYGSGSGTCWLKTAFGSASASGNNYISAVLVSKGSSSVSSSVSSSIASSSSSVSSSIVSSSSSSAPASGSTSTGSTTGSSSSSTVSSTTSSSSSSSSSSSVTLTTSSSSSVASTTSSSSSVASTTSSSSSSVASTSSSSSSIASTTSSSSSSIVSTTSSSTSSSVASTTSSSSSSVASVTSSSSSSVASTTRSSSVTTFSTSTVSSTSTSSSSSSTSASLPSGISALGCYVDSSTRALPNSNGSSSTNTPSQCALNCRALGYKYAGTEYSNECWCGNTIPATTAASTDCNMACTGDKTQNCGAGNRLSVTVDSTWQQKFFARASYGTWNLMSCYVDNTNGRLLSTTESITGGASNMTIANCLNACANSGLQYCGAEYYQECYGSKTAPNSTYIAAGADPLSAGCNYACTGNSTEACGGANKILVYVNNGTASL